MKDHFQPTMELMCHKHMDQRTGVISVFLQWEVQNVTEVLEAIGEYQIIPKLMDIRGDIPRHIAAVKEIEIPANVSSEGREYVNQFTLCVYRGGWCVGIKNGLCGAWTTPRCQ